MRQGKQNELTVILGGKGSGKSRTAKALARAALAAGRTVIVWDPNREYTPTSPERTDPVRGLARFACEDPTGRGDVVGRYLAACAAKGRALSAALEAAPDWQFPALCRFVMRVGQVLLIVDEVDKLCSPSWIPPDLKEIVSRGRHRAVDQVYISRRPAEVSRFITAGADVQVYFRFFEANDLDWLAKRLGRTFADRVRALPPQRSVTIRSDEAHGDDDQRDASGKTESNRR